VGSRLPHNTLLVQGSSHASFLAGKARLCADGAGERTSKHLLVLLHIHTHNNTPISVSNQSLKQVDQINLSFTKWHNHAATLHILF